MPQIQKMTNLALLEKMLTSAELHLARIKKEKNPSKAKVDDLQKDISLVKERMEVSNGTDSTVN